jgi:hypothetical protein
MLKASISLCKKRIFFSEALRNKGSIARVKALDLEERIPSISQSAERATYEAPRARDLPKETLYIFDGTAMLYHAHHSRESSFRHADATLTPELSTEICNRLQLDMKAYIAEKHGLTSKGNSEALGSDLTALCEETLQPPGLNENSIPLSCGALVGMATRFARFVRDVRPCYVAVAFDAGGKTFRDSM